MMSKNGLFIVNGEGFVDTVWDEAMAADEKKEYYWADMLNGGRCVKCYKPSVAAVVVSRAASGIWRLTKIETVKPEKLKLKIPRIKGRVRSKGYYQPYDLFERSMEGLS